MAARSRARHGLRDRARVRALPRARRADVGRRQRAAACPASGARLSCAGRPWFRPQLLEEWDGIVEWDAARSAQRAGEGRRALGHLAHVARNPHGRWRALRELRVRHRRSPSLVAGHAQRRADPGRGRPGSGAMRRPRLRAGRPARSDQLARYPALARRPAAAVLVDRAAERILVRALGCGPSADASLRSDAHRLPHRSLPGRHAHLHPARDPAAAPTGFRDRDVLRLARGRAGSADARRPRRGRKHLRAAAATARRLPALPPSSACAGAPPIRTDAGPGLRLSAHGLRGRLLGLSWFLEAVVVQRMCERRGIRHVHVHLDGTAPAVGSPGWPIWATAAPQTGPWSFSMTVHGSKEFFDVARQGLATKVGPRASWSASATSRAASSMALVDDTHWPRFHVVHCGIDPEHFAPPEQRPNHDGLIRILTVGRLDNIEGVAILIEAVASCAAAACGARLHRSWATASAPSTCSASRARLRGRGDHVGRPGRPGRDPRSLPRRRTSSACPASPRASRSCSWRRCRPACPVVANAHHRHPGAGAGRGERPAGPSGRHRPVGRRACSDWRRTPSCERGMGRAGREKVRSEFESPPSDAAWPSLFTDELEPDAQRRATPRGRAQRRRLPCLAGVRRAAIAGPARAAEPASRRAA